MEFGGINEALKKLEFESIDQFASFELLQKDQLKAVVYYNFCELYQQGENEPFFSSPDYSIDDAEIALAVLQEALSKLKSK